MLTCASLLVLSTWVQTPRAHPFLFLTPADIERARAAVASDPAFARLAENLRRQAAGGRTDDLPPLERGWWEETKSKPWRDTYPEIYHHTAVVPRRWALRAQACARAGALRQDEELLEAGRRILLALSDYSFEFEHYDVGMNYTTWGVMALDAYDLLYDGFSEAEHGRLDAFFERMLAAVKKNDDYWVEHRPGGELNNHYAWHKLCFAMLGLFYDRPELVEEALHGPKGVVHMMRHGFRDDGLWMEGSIPYQFAATAALLLIAEMLESAGYPTSLWRWQSGDGRTLQQSYDALFALLFPDRTLPPIGDSYASRPHLARHPDWETLYHRFREPRYAWLIGDLGARTTQALFGGVPELPPADPPPQFSRLWPEQGYAALRTVEGEDYWSGRGWTLFATYSNAPVHTNADKLSLMLFGDGHLWLPDCEARTGAEHAFSAPVQSQLNRETLCHNTLLVDGASQRHPDRRLDLIEFHLLPEVKRLTLGDLGGRLYPGVRQLRTLIVRDAYVLDVFQVEAEQERQFDWLLHVDGEPVAAAGEGWQALDFPDEVPWRYLRGPERRAVADRYWETFTLSPPSSALSTDFRVDLLAGNPVEVIRCGFPRDDSPEPETVPMRLVRARGASAWFAAVYRCGEAVGQELRISVQPGELHSYDVTVTLGGQVFTHRVPLLEDLVGASR